MTHDGRTLRVLTLIDEYTRVWPSGLYAGQQETDFRRQRTRTRLSSVRAVRRAYLGPFPRATAKISYFAPTFTVGQGEAATVSNGNIIVFVVGQNMSTLLRFACVLRYFATLDMGLRMSDVSVRLYLSKTLRVLWPVIRMQIVSWTPLRTRSRAHVRLKS
jgi:hypothetical protein